MFLGFLSVWVILYFLLGYLWEFGRKFSMKIYLTYWDTFSSSFRNFFSNTFWDYFGSFFWDSSRCFSGISSGLLQNVYQKSELIKEIFLGINQDILLKYLKFIQDFFSNASRNSSWYSPGSSLWGSSRNSSQDSFEIFYLDFISSSYLHFLKSFFWHSPRKSF